MQHKEQPLLPIKELNGIIAGSSFIAIIQLLTRDSFSLILTLGIVALTISLVLSSFNFVFELGGLKDSIPGWYRNLVPALTGISSSNFIFGVGGLLMEVNIVLAILFVLSAHLLLALGLTIFDRAIRRAIGERVKEIENIKDSLSEMRELAMQHAKEDIKEYELVRRIDELADAINKVLERVDSPAPTSKPWWRLWGKKS